MLERRGRFRANEVCAKALKASATRFGWLLMSVVQPVVFITSEAWLGEREREEEMVEKRSEKRELKEFHMIQTA